MATVDETTEEEKSATQEKADDYMVESDPTKTTEGILNRITSTDSDYMKQATSEGQRTAASRGLLNSTIAGTAGQSAALSKAFDIASQDASSYQTNLNTAQQGAISSDLSSQEATQNLTSQTQSEQASMAELQAQIAADKAQQDAELAWSQSELAQKIELEQQQMSADQQAQFAELSSTLSQEYIAQYTAILNNTDLSATARAQAIEKLNAATEAQYELLASVYSVELDWGDTTTTTSSAVDNSGDTR